MEVEVIIAFRREHDKVTLAYINGLTVEKALDQSGLLDKYNLSKQELNIGIFSEKVKLEHRLKPGDRIEIYRPLKINPKEARRIRANRRSNLN